jgi:hypothetical protein
MGISDRFLLMFFEIEGSILFFEVYQGIYHIFNPTRWVLQHCKDPSDRKCGLQGGSRNLDASKPT